MALIDVEKALAYYKEKKKDPEWVKQNQPDQELIDKVNEIVVETLEWLNRQETLERSKKTTKKEVLNQEEIDHLLSIVESPTDEDIEDKDAMLLIYENITRSIKQFISKHKKYPNRSQLVEIYTIEFTYFYKFIKKSPAVHIFCDDMVSRLRLDNVPYEIKLNDKDKTVTIGFTDIGY